MATRIYQITFTVPAGTLPTAPLTVPWLTEDNVVNDIELEIPSGHNGVTGVRVMKGDVQLLPWGQNSWIIATNYTHVFPVGDYVPTADVKLQGYNQGTVAHSFYLRMSISDYVQPRVVEQQPITPFVPATTITTSPDPLSPDAVLGLVTADQLGTGEITATQVQLIDTSDLTAPPEPAPTGLLRCIMTFYETLTLVLGFLSVVFIPMIVLLIRFTVGWTKIGDAVRELAKDVRELVSDKDKVHKEILAQMRDDRNATNQRLTWLERNLWNRRGRNQDVS